MSHKKYRSNKMCLNCGSLVEKKFCPECGQENLELRENFFHIVGETIGDFFHYDSKFLRTIVPLFTKPGFLTKEYWEGKRVRYVHPLRLFFFITIIFMIATSYFYNHFIDKVNGSVRSSEATVTGNDTTSNVPALEQNIATKSDENIFFKGAAIGLGKFFQHLKYISFFLLPLYALIFKLFYLRRKSLYVDHITFTLHVQSFAYLLISITILLPFLFPDAMGIIRRGTLFVIFVYLTLALRNLYQESWGKTMLKSLVATLLLVSCMIIVLLTYIVMSMNLSGQGGTFKFTL